MVLLGGEVGIRSRRLLCWISLLVGRRASDVQ